MRWTTLAVVVLTGCATAHVPSQPAAVNEKTVAQSPTVVVIADVGERADAARLQALVGEAVRNVRAPLKVTIHYYGAANAKSLLPVQIGKGIPRRLLFGEFTITDSAGRTLDADSIGYSPPSERLNALYHVAARIGSSVAALSER